MESVLLLSTVGVFVYLWSASHVAKKKHHHHKHTPTPPPPTPEPPPPIPVPVLLPPQLDLKDAAKGFPEFSTLLRVTSIQTNNKVPVQIWPGNQGNGDYMLWAYSLGYWYDASAAETQDMVKYMDLDCTFMPNQTCPTKFT